MEKAPGLFASIVIVLPSEFTGGSLQLSHSGRTQTISLASLSAANTAAVGWYTDVHHTLSPILSGYRLSLSYNFVHTPETAFKPSAQLLLDKALHLRHVLLSWKQAQEGHFDFEVPEKLLYVLDNKYSPDELRSTAWKGDDANLVAHLAPIAEELHFGLYIGNIEYFKQGDAMGGRCNNRRRGYYGYSSDEEDVDIEAMEMDEADVEELSVTNAVDIDGMPMSTCWDVEINDVIQSDELDDGEPDQKEYVSYSPRVSQIIVNQQIVLAG